MKCLWIACCLFSSIAQAMLSPDEKNALYKPLQDLDALYSSYRASLDVLKKDLQTVSASSATQARLDTLTTALETLYTSSDIKNQTEKAQATVELLDGQSRDAKLARTVALNNAVNALTKSSKDLSLRLSVAFNADYSKLSDEVKKLKNAQIMAQQTQNQMQQRQDDFKKAYDTVNNALDILKTQINSFPDAHTSAELTTLLNTTKLDIDALYKQAQASTDPVALQNAILGMNVKLTTLQNNVQNSAKQLNIAQAVQKAEETRRQQEEARQRFLSLLAALQPVIKEFSQQQERIKNVLIKQAVTKTYDQAAGQDIIQNAQKILEDATRAYQTHNVTIVATDLLNYVVAAYRQLVQYCLDDMALTVAQANQLFADHKKVSLGFEPLVQLAQRIKTYTVLLQKIATDSFHDKAADVLSMYKQGKERITLKPFVDALQQLVTVNQEPTAQDVTNAQAFYVVIQDNFDVLDQKMVTQWQRQIAVVMAVFAASRAHAVVKNMQSAQDNTAALEEAISLYTQAVSYYKASGDDNNQQFIARYNAMIEFLKAGQQAWRQASAQEQAQDFTDAIDAYQRAMTNFEQAGDTVNGAKARQRMQLLTAEKNYRDGQQVLHEYTQAYGNLFADYMNFLNGMGNQTLEAFDRYAPLFTALEAACQSAATYYETAYAAYVDSGSSQLERLAQGHVVPYASLPSAKVWLTHIYNGAVALHDADVLLRTQPTQDANSLYAKALQEFGAADTLYTNVPAIHDAVLPLLSDSARSAERHRAAMYAAAGVQLVLAQNDAQQQQLRANIQNVVTSFFDQGAALQQKPELLTSATLNILQEAIKKQDQFATLQKNIEQTLLQQQTVNTMLGADKNIELLTKTVDPNTGTITYSFNHGQKTLVCNNPQLVTAQLHELLGSRALADKEYVVANEALSKARDLYQSLGKPLPPTLENNYKLSVTLAAAQQWRDLVIPNKKDQHTISTVNVAGIAVPEKYALLVYEQQYPFAVPVGFDTLSQATNPEQKNQLQTQLVGMTTALYLSNVLLSQKIIAQDVIDFTTLTVKTSASSGQMSIIKKAVDDANTFKADLEKRIASKESALYVLKKDQSYFIGESYKPMFAVIPTDEQKNRLLPYPGYPVAQIYYSNAYNLFNPTRTAKTVAGITYDALSNDRDAALETLRLYVNTTLSAAAQYKKSFDAPNSTATQAIQAIKSFKPEPGKYLSDYMDKYAYLKNYYVNLIVGGYASAYQNYDKVLNDSTSAKNLALLLADTYVQLGDALSLFLVGTPLSPDYSRTVLPDIERFYKTAMSYDTSGDKAKALYKKLAQWYAAAGKQLVDQGDFIYALSYLSHVEQLYKEVPQPDTEISGLAQAATLAKFEAMFYGSTQKIQNFADKYFAGQPYAASSEQRPLITVKLSTGQQAQYTFGKLQQKNMPLMGGLGQLNTDAGEIKMYTDIQSMILDSLIFYSACSSGALAQVPNAPDATKAATDIIAQYLADNSIVLNTLEGAQQLLSRKDAQEKIMGCFAIFKQKVQQLSDKNVGYAGIAQWANQLYTAFAQVYINDFYGGSKPCADAAQECVATQQAEQWTSLKAAIDAEINALKAPSSLYL